MDRRVATQVAASKEPEERGAASARRKRILLGVAALGVAFALIGGLLLLPSGPRLGPGAPRVGDPAPDFEVTDIDGGDFRLSANLGHPVLIDFMGSNCATCAAGMPDLRTVHSTYATEGLVMLSLDVGVDVVGSLGSEDPQEARAFMMNHGGTWAIALDNSNIGLGYGVITVPTLYVIDPDGRVAFRNAGPTSAADLSAVISRYV